MVKKGSINLTELERNLTAIFCKSKRWPWQMREVESGSFLVRFPPWKSIKELSEFPYFDLEKQGVTIKISAWEGDVSPIGNLQDTWITVKGLPPK